MTPTNQLRFVERKTSELIAGGHTVTKTVRILQQWWEFPDEPELGGQWEDVPVETEETK